MVTCEIEFCNRPKYDCVWDDIEGRWRIWCTWHLPSWRAIQKDREEREREQASH